MAITVIAKNMSRTEDIMLVLVRQRNSKISPKNMNEMTSSVLEEQSRPLSSQWQFYNCLCIDLCPSSLNFSGDFIISSMSNILPYNIRGCIWLFVLCLLCSQLGEDLIMLNQIFPVHNIWRGLLLGFVSQEVCSFSCWKAFLKPNCHRCQSARFRKGAKIS